MSLWLKIAAVWNVGLISLAVIVTVGLAVMVQHSANAYPGLGVVLVAGVLLVILGAGDIALIVAWGVWQLAQGGHNRVLTGGSTAILLAIGFVLVRNNMQQGSVLNSPHGMAFEPNGNLLVADTGDSRIVEFSPAGSVLTTWGSLGYGLGEFSDPDAIALGKRQEVYITEYAGGDIQQWTLAGKPLRRVGLPGKGYGGTLSGIVVDSHGTVWVSRQYAVPRMLTFSSALQAGGLRSHHDLVTCGTGDGPYNLALGQHDTIYVADDQCNDIRVYSHGGVLLTHFGDGQFGEYDGPGAIAVDRQGIVYAVDPDHGSIVRFASSGELLSAWKVPELSTTGTHDVTEDPETMGTPGIAIDRSGNVYVATPRHILKFSPTGRIIARWG